MPIRFSLIMICALGLATAHADSSEPDVLVKPCIECHGTAGVAVARGTPHLNGQLAPYLVEAMIQFRRHRRPSSVPEHIPTAYTDGQLATIAQYFSSAKAVRPKPEGIDGQRIEAGAAIHAKRCMECHPDNGRESDKDAPLMAAQDLDYLLAQTEAFRAGKRKFAFLMDEAYRDLAQDELASVAYFFASQDQLAPVTGKKRRKKPAAD
ncbi:c-type cytochrome [Denitratisoma oestradiolicum]|uniref:Cytochrome c domain-containing protein n=1 Tax=Denitratisoma oestradiolicum TaxID=311182 RepID=A0A6S6YI84_9PROT|nr:hypothetical protein [Denitratisoma oestradiolicum]CAB1367464.1 exported protein of unknown function [Denitratisoma oestradiolicum]